MNNGFNNRGSNFNAMNMYKLNNVPVRPLIGKMDYKNKNNFLHNNVKETILDEHVVEYKIHIDSIDRDIARYPDPFHYTVQFNPVSNRIHNEKQSGGTYQLKYYRPEAKPHINKEFKNIKYIKIDNVCLPRYKIIKKDEGLETYSQFQTDSDESNLYDDRFIELRIEELIDNKNFSTNSHTQDSFGLVFPDKLISSNYFIGAPFYMSRTYNTSQLGNLKRLTIDFYDSYGSPIRVNSVDENDENLSTTPYNDIVTEDTSINMNHEVSVPTTDLRHPLNKKIQNFISLRIGVVESQQNNNIQY